MLFRFLTGASIGGEYTAINSTIQEFTPARLRGWTDLAINGTFWVGAGIGAAGSMVLLTPGMLPPDWGWRTCFLIGAALGLTILFMRMWVPESSRWLITHNQVDEARQIVEDIEAHFREHGLAIPDTPVKPLQLKAHESTPLGEVFHSLFNTHRRRSLVGLMLMTAQAFFYNAIFFTYALVLTDFYKVPGDHIGWYVLPFAAGNFLGPMLLGKLFDVIGRRRMIAFTYAISGVMLTISGWMFMEGMLTVTTQTIAWMVIRGGGEFGVSDRQRDLSARDPRPRHRGLLRVRHGARWHHRAYAVRPVDRHARERGAVFIGYLIGSGLMLAAAVVTGISGSRRNASPWRTLRGHSRPRTSTDAREPISQLADQAISRRPCSTRLRRPSPRAACACAARFRVRAALRRARSHRRNGRWRSSQ